MHDGCKHGLPTRRSGLFAILYLLRLTLFERIVDGYRDVGPRILVNLPASTEHAVLKELFGTLFRAIEAIRCRHKLFGLGNKHVAEQLGIDTTK